MNRIQKKELLDTLHKKFLASSSVIVTHINGLTVSESTKLRTEMRKANCNFKVTKNKIVKLALKKTGFEHLENLFRGPTAIGLSNDPILPAKILVKFSKETDKMKIIGGGLSEKPLSIVEIENLANLPGLDDLRSKIIGLLRAPSVKIVKTIIEPSSRINRLIVTKK